MYAIQGSWFCLRSGVPTRGVRFVCNRMYLHADTKKYAGSRASTMALWLNCRGSFRNTVSPCAGLHCDSSLRNTCLTRSGPCQMRWKVRSGLFMTEICSGAASCVWWCLGQSWHDCARPHGCQGSPSIVDNRTFNSYALISLSRVDNVLILGWPTPFPMVTSTKLYQFKVCKPWTCPKSANTLAVRAEHP